MAERSARVDPEFFSCSICLELLKEPVTIPCGHSYCWQCIRRHWDGEGQEEIHSCPQCRRTFRERPALEKNIMLAALVEELKKCGSQADRCYKGAEEKRICVPHGEAMEIFCRTDREIICRLCSMDRHKGHDLVDAEDERSEKRERLERSRKEIHQRIQDGEKDLNQLREESEAGDASANKAAEESEEIFNQMIDLIREKSSDVKRRIRSQQESRASRAKELQKDLERELEELKRIEEQLEKFSRTEDHAQFLLLGFPSVPALTSRNRTTPGDFADVTAAVSETRKKMEEVLKVPLPEPQPETREDFLKYSQQLTLDPNTAHPSLFLSERNRKATLAGERQPYPSHPDRFTYWWQVLSMESLAGGSGRSYWEVEWRGGLVNVAVAYGNISRTGDSDESRFGFNDKSWSLRRDAKTYKFYQNKTETPVSGPLSSRLGVYVDQPAGVLCFYSVSKTMELLHRVRTSFTEPLHAGLRFYNYSLTGGDAEFAEFVKLK